jgi:hypothetical protein
MIVQQILDFLEEPREFREIRSLSLWQPYACLIAMGLKKYETRSWGTNYRGLIAIHAAKRPCKIGELTVLLEDFCEIGREADFRQMEATIKDSTQYGAIVAVARLDACLKMVDISPKTPFPGEVYIDARSALEKTVGWWEFGRFAWRLKDVVAVSPIPYKGHQGIREVIDKDVLSKSAAHPAIERLVSIVS